MHSKVLGVVRLSEIGNGMVVTGSREAGDGDGGYGELVFSGPELPAGR